MDNLGGLVVSAVAGMVALVAVVAVVIGLSIGYFVGSSNEEVPKEPTKIEKKVESRQATSTRINFDTRK